MQPMINAVEVRTITQSLSAQLDRHIICPVQPRPPHRRRSVAAVTFLQNDRRSL